MKNYDVVVVGAGNAALCAAISARESGAEVLVLERAPKHKRGGNSYFTDGAIRFAYNDLNDIREIVPELTDEQAEKIVMPKYGKEDYFQDLMRVTGGKSSPELAEQLVKHSYPTIRWAKQQGVGFELNYSNQSFEKDGKYQFWGGLPVKTKNIGMGLIALFSRAEQIGIDIFYDSRAIELKMEGRRVSSIMVEKQEQTLEIEAAAVILACGSFEANKEMRKKYIGDEWEAAIVRGTEYNTGDGLSMALSAGAQRFGEWSGCHAIGTDYQAPKVGDFSKPGDIFKKHSYPLSIMVNQNGYRFVDEGADFRNYTYAKYGKEILKQPGHVAYQIYDQQVRPMLRKEYNLEEATYYQADTLEELVELLPVNDQQFLQTIEEYNRSIMEGKYDPTIKDNKRTQGVTPPKSNWALPIEKGPFYAFPVTCGITFSFGGIKVSPHAEVLDENEQPIPGLFAAGEMVGGIFYGNYPGGSGLMSGAVFGRISGNTAVSYIQAAGTVQ
ncbi:FAD-dependent tricarballylate dehydrogenase TcuA [Sediminibacillus halophilus]|uniref:Tricarballylate dehydrogenase n=1 Tax=Sediminibacillus halophilus TaxID=482461 RepID=A0A1G9S017_9BACI|nr:FAD-dependent tricarballylate dehydrogenase TcuA [Sediminibacillus halophilus]SDM28762.1 tricarballylate dehydrogenase [Sediminibacillus halophilus]